MPLIIRIIKEKELLDQPGGRKIHQEAIPSMGGIGIVLALLVALVSMLNAEQWYEARFFMLGLGIMFFLGLRDDLVVLKAMQKLIGQLVAIFVVVVLGDIRISSMYGFMGVEELPLWFSYALTIFAITGLTNAFNLIDGLDGLAGTLSVLSFVFLGGWFWVTGFTTYALISLAMIGGISAFLIFNWHPAKIFMGDTGSLTIGFVLAVFSVIFVEANGVKLLQGHPMKFQNPITAGLGIMVISCIDTLRVFVRRILKGCSPMKADKSHVHHFLLRMGYGHNKVACILGLVKLMILAFVMATSSLSDTVILPITAVGVVALGLLLDRQTLRKVKEKAKNTPPILKLSTSQNYKSTQKEPIIRQKALKKEPV
ncbi:MraY family glycosyltransferase [Echinicola jeungdonensis]|uniref:MraY family glycosyltransferase n=2 Tax=Echinicola jeungdonensis TaxID=709343 RepID=A0ABV5JB22_9BACT